MHGLSLAPWVTTTPQGSISLGGKSVNAASRGSGQKEKRPSGPPVSGGSKSPPSRASVQSFAFAPHQKEWGSNAGRPGFEPVGASPSPSFSSASFDDKENGPVVKPSEDTPGQGTSRLIAGGSPMYKPTGGKALSPGSGVGSKLPRGSMSSPANGGARRPLSGSNLPNLVLTALPSAGPFSQHSDGGRIMFANQSPMLLPPMSLQMKPTTQIFSNDRCEE